MAIAAIGIPKDRIKRLRELATEASRSETSFEKASKQLRTASNNLVNAARELATQLYEVACDYADQPLLVEAELKRLAITVKSSSTVYIRICRLAFTDPNAGGDPDRSRISRYATLIERAHKQGMSKDAFAKLAASGVNSALHKLLAETFAEPIQIGKKEARKLFGSEVVLDNLTLGSPVEEGADLQLLARYEGGKVVVYGMVPPDIGDATAVLKRIGGAKLSESRRLGDVFPEVLRTIKLVGSINDAKLIGSYVVGRATCQFVVESNGSFAELSFPKRLDFMSGTDAALPAQTWAQISKTIGVVGKQPLEATFDGTNITVGVGGLKGEPLVDWLAKKKKPAIGAVLDDTIVIPITTLPSTKTARVGRSKGAETYDEQQLDALLTYKPTTAYTDVQCGAGKVTLKPVKSKSKTGNLVSRKSFRLLKAAASKLLSWSKGTVSVSCPGGYVVLEASYRDFTYSMSVPTA